MLGFRIPHAVPPAGAAHLAVERAIGELECMLADEPDLLQADAVNALLEAGHSIETARRAVRWILAQP